MGTTINRIKIAAEENFRNLPTLILQLTEETERCKKNTKNSEIITYKTFCFDFSSRKNFAEFHRGARARLDRRLLGARATVASLSRHHATVMPMADAQPTADPGQQTVTLPQFHSTDNCTVKCPVTQLESGLSSARWWQQSRLITMASGVGGGHNGP